MQMSIELDECIQTNSQIVTYFKMLMCVLGTFHLSQNFFFWNSGCFSCQMERILPIGGRATIWLVNTYVLQFDWSIRTSYSLIGQYVRATVGLVNTYELQFDWSIRRLCLMWVMWVRARRLGRKWKKSYKWKAPFHPTGRNGKSRFPPGELPLECFVPFSLQPVQQEIVAKRKVSLDAFHTFTFSFENANSTF